MSATLGVAQGGTGAATFTSNGVLYGNGTGAIQATAAGTSAQFLVANGSGVPTFVSMSSDATISNAGVLTIAADAVALGTDTTGNYVATVSTSALTGITGGAAGSEGTAITLGFDYSATLAANPALATGNAVFGTTGLIFEGATADTFEGLLTVTDPTADNTWTLPNVSGTVITTGNLTSITATGTIASGTWNGTAIGAQYGGTGINTSASTGVPTISSGTWSVASSLGVTLGGTGTTTQFTQGSIVFAGASGVYTQDNANFFWDDTNNRLGIGTTNPAAMLSLYGASNALRLSYDGSNYNTISTTSTGEFLVSSSNTSESQILVGSGGAVDTSIAFDGNSNDYFSGVDNTTGSYMIGSGFVVQSGSAFLTITSGGLIGINMTPVARFDVTHSSTSTTGATEYSERNTFSDTGVVTTGTDTTYGDYVSVTRTGATGGTINSYGQYVTLVTDNAGAGTSTAYGSYIDTGVAGATNADTVYGQYINTESNAGTAYGLYVDAGSGAGTEYAAIFMNGNVGIGIAAPTVALQVSGILKANNVTIGTGGDAIDVSTGTMFLNYYNANSISMVAGGGSVGIGDNTPDSPLEILSTTSPQFRLSYTDGSVDGTIGVDSNEYLTLQAGTSGEIKRVQIGAGGAGSTTPDFFGLDVKSDTGDPAGGYEGAMYYNTFDNKFRCYQGAAWADCITSGMAIGGSITSATAGSILFAGAAGVLAQDNANFFWDDTNNRLGIGTTNPAAMLSLYGASNALRLSYDGSNYNTISTTSTGEFLVSSSNTSESQILVGSGGAVDTSIAFDGNSNDYFSGVDNTTGSYMIGSGFVVQSGSAFLTITSGGLIGINMTPVARFDVTHSSTSTTGATEYSERNTFSDTGVVTTGTDTTYGDYVSVTRTGATGGTINSYGQYVTLVTDNAGAGTSTAYGSYIDTGVAGATNADTVYGQYINTESNAGTAYGLYVDAGSGAGTEYAAIFMNGNVGIGIAAPAYKFEVDTDVASNYVAQFFNDGNNANRYGIQIQGGADDGSGTTYYVNALDGDGGQVGYIANTAGTFALTDVSDIRTKTNITDTAIGPATTILNSLRVVDFNRLSDPGGPRITGFIAQEVESVYPQAVTTGPTGLLGISKESFIPVLVKAFQEEDVRLGSVENSLSSIDLRTDVNATTLGALQTSVDSQLVTVSGELNAIKADNVTQAAALATAQIDITNLKTDANALVTRTTAIETSLSTMQTQIDTLTDFFAVFDMDNVIVKDASGDVDLLGGKLAARVIETGGIVVVNAIVDAPTIGTTVVYPVAKDDDADGNDDYTDLPMNDPTVVARDGKYAEVLTKAMIPMVNGSRIFTSFKGNPGAFSWVDKTIDVDGDYVGFKIRLADPVTVPVKVDWWLIEQK